MSPIPPPPGPSPLGDEDAILVRQIRAGQEEALQQLHRRYAPLVFHLACRALDRPAAEEIVQDTFLSVWRKAADFDPGRGSVRTWVLSIGHHRMLDELRARSRRPQVAGDLALDPTLSAEEPLPDEAHWRDYQRDAISGALAALPEPQRAALRLAFFADLTHEEVARALHVPLGTAKTRIRSGLRLLERHLGRLVALLALALAGTGSWLYQRHGAGDSQSQRALHLLADSQTRALRLTPSTGTAPAEAGLHATFRSAPGQALAVITLTHFPAPAEGEGQVLWLRTPRGWWHVSLQRPDQAGQSLQVLESPRLAESPLLELRITQESRPADQPAGATIVSWPQSPGQEPPAP